MPALEDIEDNYNRLYKLEECSVCLDPLVSNLAISDICGHVMHKECLTSSIKFKHECPTCKSTVEETNVKDICFNVDNVENNELWQTWKTMKSNHGKMVKDVEVMNKDMENLNKFKIEKVLENKELFEETLSLKNKKGAAKI